MLGTSNVMGGFKQCENDLFQKCKEQLVASFQEFKGVNDPDIRVRPYCARFEIFGHCLSEGDCHGYFIDSYRYMILQERIMDISGVCKYDHELILLKNNIDAGSPWYRIKFEKNLADLTKDLVDIYNPIEPAELCGKRIHYKCTVQMQEELANGGNLCTSHKNFIKCYKNQEEPCTGKKHEVYKNFLEKYASKLLELNKKHPGFMPDC
ncbi:uncharacterized protein LOC144659834 [Oculina patagonica]